MAGKNTHPRNINDGVGVAASFYAPRDVQISKDDTFAIIVDTYGHSIRKLNLATWQVTTIAGNSVTKTDGGGAVLHVPGSDDGVGGAASFNYPNRASISDDMTFALVADAHNGIIRRIDLATNKVTTVPISNGAHYQRLTPAELTNGERPHGVEISEDGDFALVANSRGQGIR